MLSFKRPVVKAEDVVNCMECTRTSKGGEEVVLSLTALCNNSTRTDRHHDLQIAVRTWGERIVGAHIWL